MSDFFDLFLLKTVLELSTPLIFAALGGLLGPPALIAAFLSFLYSQFGDATILRGLAGIAAAAIGLMSATIAKMAQPVLSKLIAPAPQKLFNELEQNHLLLIGEVHHASSAPRPPLVYGYRTYGTHSQFAAPASIDQISA